MTSSIPEPVLSKVEMSPAEDLFLYLLRDALPDIDVRTLYGDDQTFPVVLARSEGSFGNWRGDARFIDTVQLGIDVLCDGIDSDQECAWLSEAVRVALRDSVNKVTPYGWLTHIDMTARPRRTPDWATSVGPVQYADLPTGVTRYESTYNAAIRRPRTRPFPAP